MYILLSGWIKVTAGAVYLIQCVYMYMYSLKGHTHGKGSPRHVAGSKH